MSTGAAFVRNMGAWAFVLASLVLAKQADAFVPVPVGGHPGEVDASMRVGYEGGLIEPTENEASWQKAQWLLFQVGGGYTIGSVGPFQDFFVRLDHTFYSIPAETSLAEDRVKPELPGPARCLATPLEDGGCEFYPSDRGWIITPAVGANLIHEATHSFGLFLQGSIPIGVLQGKFVLPRVDYVAGGTQVGVHLTDWFGFSNRIYVGSGDFGGDEGQNAAIAITTLFHFDTPRFADRTLKLGLSLGPYFEGDLTERNDEAYDAAYTIGYEDGVRDRIRAMKFGLAISPYFQITDHFAIDGGYVQKFFGYDAPATQFFYGGIRFAQDIDG
jgi:hypothetical protein